MTSQVHFKDKQKFDELVQIALRHCGFSEYLSLPSAPSTYHSESLTDGQIWLRLPPLTTEDSVVVAGYKITCSTDVSLTPPTPGCDGLVPANTRDVLLSPSDVTRTFYAAVQIVRNINRKKIVEDKYSDVSAAFCTGKD